VKLTQAQLIEIAHRHAQAEAACDIEAIMGTLEADPVYEFCPLGRGFSGAQMTRRWYETFVREFMPRVAGFSLRGEWLGGSGLAQEYQVSVRGDDGQLRDYAVLGILVFGESRLQGERIYSSEELVRLMAGNLWPQLRPC
jgi:hypothetical protein